MLKMIRCKSIINIQKIHSRYIHHVQNKTRRRDLFFLDQKMEEKETFYKIYQNKTLSDDEIIKSLKRLNRESLIKKVKEDSTCFQRYGLKDEECSCEEYDITQYKKDYISNKIIEGAHYISTIGNIYDKNEDNMSYNYYTDDGKNMYIFGIYDGHGENGNECSKIISKLLTENLINSINSSSDFNLYSILDNAFNKTYTKTKKMDIFNKSGTTACLCIIYKDSIFCANLGDSGACYVNSTHLLPITTPHSLTKNDSELRRVMGMNVPVSNYFDQIRNIGSDMRYELTRSFGSLNMEYITARPDITETKIVKSQINFLIIFSDGVTMCLDYQDIENLVLMNGDDSEIICNYIVKQALADGSEDNISCIVINLDKLPKNKQ